MSYDNKPINNEFKPLVKTSPKLHTADKNKYRGRGSVDERNNPARIAGKYESDKEEFESARRLNQIRRDIDHKERINDSR